MLPKSKEQLESENAILRALFTNLSARFDMMEAQRNKFVHKYRKVCKAYNWLCHVTNRRFKAEDKRAYKHLHEAVALYEQRRSPKIKS